MPALQGTESSCGMGHLANPATTCMQALKSPFSSSIFTCGGAQTLAVQLPGTQGTQHHRQPSGGAMSPLAPSSILPCSLPSALLTQTRSLQPQHGCQNSSLCGHASSTNKASRAWLAPWDSLPTPSPEAPYPPLKLSRHTPRGRHNTPPASCSHTTATLGYSESALPKSTQKPTPLSCKRMET